MVEKRQPFRIVGLEDIERKAVDSWLDDIHAVGSADEVARRTVGGQCGDRHARHVMSVLLVDADILVEEPVLVAKCENVIRLVGESRSDPRLVLADSEDPFRKSWRIIGVGRRCRRRERRDGRRYCAVAEELDRGIDAVRGAPLDAAVVPREEIAVRWRQAVRHRRGVGLERDAGRQGVDEG